MKKETIKEYGKGQNDPLGIYANIVSHNCNKKETKEINDVDFIRENKRRELRKETFKLQRKAAELLPYFRVSKCLWAVYSIEEPINIIHNTVTKRAHFTNLQTCGSVWSCPCCSNHISEKRKEELNTLLAYSRKENFFPIMLTLTVKHSVDCNIKYLLESLKKQKEE